MTLFDSFNGQNGHASRFSRIAALGTALLGAFAVVSPAASAQSSDDALEVVVVTGIRSSIADAVETKRNSNQFVDAVSAEDVGKFPDNNVAEALQRIPGVAIDRVGGEGQQITVRGFGPDFNTVLLNGRRLASELPNSRGFRFDTISAELIGGAEVYKTSPTHLQEGGIGSTVNLNTLRPLDIADTAIVRGQGTYEDLSGEVAPSAFGMLSRSFADGRIGVLGSVSYQTRKLRRDEVWSNGWVRQTVSVGDTGGLADAVGNVPGEYFHSQALNVVRVEGDRERFGANGTIQFRPSETLEVTVDGFYSHLVDDAVADWFAAFYVANLIDSATIDANNTLVAFSNVDNYNDVIYATDNRDSDLSGIAGNMSWTPSDNFNASVDVSYSSAKVDGLSDDGRNAFIVGRQPAGTLFYDQTGGGPVPTFSADLDPGTTSNGLLAHFSDRLGVFAGGRSLVENDLLELKGDFEWTSDEGALRAVRAGLFYSEDDKTNSDFGAAAACFYCGGIGELPDSLSSISSGSGFLSSTGQSFPDFVVFPDGEAVFSALSSDAVFSSRDTILGLAPGTSAATFPSTGYDQVPLSGSFLDVAETLFAIHGAVEFGSEEGLLPWTATLGFRYVETSLTSTGTEASLVGLLDQGSGNTGVVLAPETLKSESQDYSDFLPSFNFRVNPTDDLVLRFGYSQTLTRPPLVQLNPSIRFATNARPTQLNAAAGNPDLEPFRSTNIDVSAEYYYGDSNYIQVGYFNKEVDGFIVVLSGAEDFTITNPDGISSPIINGTTATYTVTRPQNLDVAKVEGLEVALTHVFDTLPAPFDGLGVQASAVFVDSNAVIDVNDTSQTFALAGLGDSYSIVGFYENERFNARVAFTSRDKFLASATHGPSSEPLFTRQYDQLDARVSYFVNDWAEIFVDGVNLTDEVREQHGRFDNHFVRYEENGPRFTFGVTMRF